MGPHLLRSRATRRVLGGVALAFAVAGCSDAAEPPPTPPATAQGSPEPPAGDSAPEGVEGVIAAFDLTNDHTQDPVDYPTYPPMGGDHFPVWITCGYYDAPVPDVAAVHSLEHGAVWIAYDPGASPDIEALRALAEGDGHLLIAPYPGLRAPFVVTAWGRQLDLDSLDDPRFVQFLEAYLRAGDAPEPGATCDGGITP